MAQASLFTKPQLQDMKSNQQPPKVWTGADVIPFGPYQWKTLNWLADEKPEYLEWWIRQASLLITQELRLRIHYSKYLAKKAAG